MASVRLVRGVKNTCSNFLLFLIYYYIIAWLNDSQLHIRW